MHEVTHQPGTTRSSEPDSDAFSDTYSRFTDRQERSLKTLSVQRPSPSHRDLHLGTPQRACSVSAHELAASVDVEDLRFAVMRPRPSIATLGTVWGRGLENELRKPSIEGSINLLRPPSTQPLGCEASRRCGENDRARSVQEDAMEDMRVDRAR